MKKQLLTRKERRKLRTRSKITGTANRPRLSVFRSNRHIFAQLIDDAQGKTLAAVSEKDITKEENKKIKKTEIAKLMGKILAEKALKVKIGQALFDRGSYKYHGRVKALAEGAREGGLKI